MIRTVYISGPMTGTVDWGRERFNAMDKRLHNMGWQVINPACLPTDLPPKCYMPICLAMLREADAVLMLKGWDKSKGATMERRYAEYLNKIIWYENMLPEEV